MIDFFDEDFPLTKKQEEAALAAKEAEKESEAESLTVKQDEIPTESLPQEENPTEEELQGEADDLEDLPDSEAQDTEDDGEASEQTQTSESEEETEHIIEEQTVEEPDESENADLPQADSSDFPDKIPTIEDIDAALHAELKDLVEKLDNMERFVDNMESARTEEQDQADPDSPEFSYEYDDRYFAEEETPAYKYPELYKKASSGQQPRHKKASDRKNITLNKKNLLKAGAIAAAAIAAVKLLSCKDD